MELMVLAAKLLKMVVINPSTVGINDRQATKLYHRLGKVHEDRNEAVRRAIKVAKVRAITASATIYIANVGGSGSHWVQAMLSALTPMLPCGEVYLPQCLLKRVAELPVEERGTFMHAYYAIHGWDATSEISTASAINTAHIAKPIAMAQYEHDARLILLTRDPVDIVMSRTFRKPEYRAAIGQANTSDAGYMQINIKFVRDFFRSVRRDDFDAEVRYKDLKDRPFDTLRYLARVLELDVSDDKVRGVAEGHTAEQLVKSGGGGNFYTGLEYQPPENMVEQARVALADVREKLGYC